MTGSGGRANEREERCENCTRLRPIGDLFWHDDDQAWYCQHVWVCERRAFVLAQKDALGERDIEKSGVTVW